MSRRRVVITLPPDAYRRLADLAEEEERVIDQQASLLLRRLLLNGANPADATPAGREREDKSRPAVIAPRRDGGHS